MKRIFVLFLVAVFLVSCNSGDTEKDEEEVKRVAEDFAIHAMSEKITEEDEDFSMVDPVLGKDLIKFLKVRNEIIRGRLEHLDIEDSKIINREIEIPFLEIEDDKAFIEFHLLTEWIDNDNGEDDDSSNTGIESGMGEWMEIFLKKNESGEWKVVQAISDSFWNLPYAPEEAKEIFHGNEDTLEKVPEDDTFQRSKKILEDFKYLSDDENLERIKEQEREALELIDEE